MVSVRNLLVQPQGKDIRLRFKLHNLTDNVIAGRISVYVIARNASTFQVGESDDELSFAIREFRVVNSLMELPSGLNLEEALDCGWSYTHDSDQKLFAQMYIMSDIIGNE